MSSIHEGSKFFAFGTVANRDYYPTNGYGGSAETTTGDIDDSEMANAAIVVIDALQITANDAGGGTWTLKNAAGTTIDDWVIPGTGSAGGLVGREIPLGWRIPAAGGITLSSNDAACLGVCTYRTVMPTVT